MEEEKMMQPENAPDTETAEKTEKETEGEILTLSEEEAKQIREKNISTELQKKLLEAAEKQYAGILELQAPISVRGAKIEKLAFDFRKLTAEDLAAAMDDGRRGVEMGNMTSMGQRLHMFAKAVEYRREENGGADRWDVLKQMSAMDAVTACELAANFFNSCSRKGRINFTKA